MAVRQGSKKRTGGSTRRKVWHIADFRELFELPDDLRKDRPGPLSYTKSFVALSGLSKEPEIRHFERLQELKARPERHLLRSVFEDLKNWSGKKTLKHRGYFLTTAEQPASYEYLAAQLRLNVIDLKKAIPILEQVGLIERVPFSVWANDSLKKAAKKRKKVKKGTRSSQRKTGPRKKGKKPDSSGRIRMKSDEIGNPLKNGKRKAKEKIKDKKNLKTNGKRQGKEEEEDKNKRLKEPIKPQVSAKGERKIRFSASPALKNTDLLANVTKKMLHRYNPHAKRFALEIYAALKLPWDMESDMAKRELGCFASLWHNITDIPPPTDDQLWERAVSEARKIASRRQNRKKGAVFCVVFEKLKAAYESRAAM